MTVRVRMIVPLAAAVLSAQFVPHSARAADADMARLQAEVSDIAQVAGGRIGVAMRHIESGRQVTLNAAERFAMASTFKLALAIELLARVDQGAVSLDRTITVRRSDLRAGSGTLRKSFDEARPGRTLGELLELMMIHSDNSATDLIWTEVGGAKPVMARLATLGVSGMSVDRPTRALLAAAFGKGPVPDEGGAGGAGTNRAAAIAAFYADTRDTTTPEAMLDLLVKLWRREALSPERTALLLDIMYRCETGKGRLKGQLGLGARVAHKTGTLQIGITNDAGIIELGRAGHLAIVVMLSESPGSLAVQEHTIARIAYAAYRHFR